MYMNINVPDSSNIGVVEQVAVTQQYLQSPQNKVFFLHVVKVKLFRPARECRLTWTRLLSLAFREQVTTENIAIPKMLSLIILLENSSYNMSEYVSGQMCTHYYSKNMG